MNKEQAIRLMGIEPVYELLHDIVLSLKGFEYHFLHIDEYEEILRRSLTDAARIYWHEMLQRAHLASTTALLRQQRWLGGAVGALTADNFIVFAACLRGFLESSADICDGLKGLAETLAREFSRVRAALAGEALEFAGCKEIEDGLIHFQFARRLPGETPPNPIHRPKLTKEYLTQLQGADTGPLHDWYAELCDVTHPGASSVVWFTPWTVDADRAESRCRIDIAPDRQAILALCHKQGALVPWVAQRGSIGP